MTEVWLILAYAGSNDPSPDILGAWSTLEAANKEADRLREPGQVTVGYLIEVSRMPVDQPWPQQRYGGAL